MHPAHLVRNHGGTGGRPSRRISGHRTRSIQLSITPAPTCPLRTRSDGQIHAIGVMCPPPP